MWFFTRGGGDSNEDERSTVSSLSNAADAETVVLKRTKGKGHEEGILSQSLLERSTREQLALKKGDGRTGFFDTDLIDCVLTRYSKEMAIADQLMKQKEQQEKDKNMLHFYDYNADKRYQQWLNDQERVRKTLKIHWLDEIVDNFFLCLTYLARIGTTVGFFHGVGRSLYLYRTMDKMYARLHGVSFANIVLYEVSLSVIKGALTAVAGSLGVIVGESSTSIAKAIFTGNVSLPERTWVNIWVCGTFCGFFGGGAFGALNASLLTPWGRTAALVGFTAVGSLSGLGLARYTYNPFVSTRQGRLYDPYWRPWYQRRLNDGGGAYMRGKYT